MLKVVLRAPNPIFPFHEPARDLRLQNYPLWLWQRLVLSPYVEREIELLPGQPLPQRREEMLVYRDNLFFDAPYIEKFLQEARRLRKPVRAAFPPAIRPSVNMRCPSLFRIHLPAICTWPICGTIRTGPFRMLSRW
jgi:hypothetical protein